MRRDAVSILVVLAAVVLLAGFEAWAAEAESTMPAAQGAAPAAEQAAPDASSAGLAARVEAVEKTVQQQNQVIEKQNQTIDIQQREIGELKAQGAKSSDSLVALESKVQENQKQQAKTELPSWMNGLTFSGDLRLRYEGMWLKPRSKTKFDDQRGRFRLRFGIQKKIDDNFDLGFRLASGADNTPTTANQTLTGDFAKKPVWIDLAYINFHPTGVPGLTIAGGKFKNPYVNTDMVWSADLNPEGAYETYKIKFADPIEPFITLGQNMLSDSSGNDIRDSNLLAYQTGVNAYFPHDVIWTTAATYYDFQNYGKNGNYFKADGNTVGAHSNLAAHYFDVFNFTNIIKIPVAGVMVQPYVDYAKNVKDMAIVNGTRQDTAWAVGAQVGAVQNKGDWSVLYKYAKIDADAVVGAIDDDPFQFANTQGHKISVSYGVAKNTALTVTVYFLRPVTAAEVRTDTVQADLMVTF